MLQRRALMVIMIGVLVFGICAVNVKSAECADATSSVSVSATVLGAALTTQAKNVSDNQPATEVGFGSISGSTTYATPSAYIEVAYNANEVNWALEIYTNNTGWTGSATGDRGGLIGQVNTNSRVPMLWQVYDGAQASHPALSQSEVDAGNWTWVKDKGDPDWATSEDYRRVLAGNATHTWLKGYPGGDGPTNTISPVAFYLGGKFEGNPADNYSTTVVLDIYHW